MRIPNEIRRNSDLAVSHSRHANGVSERDDPREEEASRIEDQTPLSQSPVVLAVLSETIKSRSTIPRQLNGVNLKAGK